MKQLLSAFLLFLAPLAGSAQTDEPVNLVFIGNSITQGVTLSDPATESPCVQAGNALHEMTGRTVTVKNHGHSGSTTYNWQAPNSGWLNEAVNDAAMLNSQAGQLFVSIMLGTNDSAERGPTGAPVSIANYYANMRGIVEYVLTKAPKAMIVIQYPIWYSPNTENTSLYGLTGLDRLYGYHAIIDDLVSDLAAEYPGHVYAGSREPWAFFENNLDYFTPEQGRQGTFHLHPNAAGARKLGEYWAQSVEGILRAQIAD